MTTATTAAEKAKEAQLIALQQNAQRRNIKRQHWELELSIRIHEAATNGHNHIDLTRAEHEAIQTYVNPVNLQGYTVVKQHTWLEGITYRLYWNYHHLPQQLSQLDRLRIWWAELWEPKPKNQPPF